MAGTVAGARSTGPPPTDADEGAKAVERVVMVIAPSVFRDEEYVEPKAVLEARGAEVTIASTRPGTCVGKLGLEASASVSVADARMQPWDAVVFVGGGGAEVFFDDPEAHALARDAVEREAVLGAICIAPSTLARAGLLRGRPATAFPSQQADLVAHGATVDRRSGDRRWPAGDGERPRGGDAVR